MHPIVLGCTFLRMTCAAFVVPAVLAILARADALDWWAQKRVCNAAFFNGEVPGALSSDKAAG